MTLDLEGDWPPALKAQADQFIAACAAHPRIGDISGRLVLSDSADPTPAFQQWMKEDEFASWLDKARFQPVTASGKTFVARDGVVTAAAARLEDADAQLELIAHEILELADLQEQVALGWMPPTDARELLGYVFSEEYGVERVRVEVFDGLGWDVTAADDRIAGLVEIADQIVAALPVPRYDPPAMDFWAAWQTLARLWALACGRATRSKRAQEVLERWSDHPLSADDGWLPVREALAEIHEQDGTSRDDRVQEAAARVWGAIEAYGRAAWSTEPHTRSP